MVFSKLIVWDICAFKIYINVAKFFVRPSKDICEYELLIYCNTFYHIIGHSVTWQRLSLLNIPLLSIPWWKCSARNSASWFSWESKGSALCLVQKVNLELICGEYCFLFLYIFWLRIHDKTPLLDSFKPTYFFLVQCIPISSSLRYSGWVSFMLLGSSNWLMLGGMIKGSLIRISIKNKNQICVG